MAYSVIERYPRRRPVLLQHSTSQASRHRLPFRRAYDTRPIPLDVKALHSASLNGKISSYSQHQSLNLPHGPRVVSGKWAPLRSSS